MNETIIFNGHKYTCTKGQRYYRLSDRSKAESLLHRAIWIYHKGDILEGHHIHHKDANRLNNDIDNLECLEQSIHHKIKWQEKRKEMLEAILSNRGEPYKRSIKHKQETSKRNSKYWKESLPSEIQCPDCKKMFVTKQPKLALRCRPCQKKKHYSDSQEQRNCELCRNPFMVYKYSHTTTCSMKCRKIKENETKR